MLQSMGSQRVGLWLSDWTTTTRTPSAVIAVHTIVYSTYKALSKVHPGLWQELGSPGSPQLATSPCAWPFTSLRTSPSLAFHRLGSFILEGREALVSRDLMESRWWRATWVCRGHWEGPGFSRPEGGQRSHLQLADKETEVRNVSGT